MAERNLTMLEVSDLHVSYGAIKAVRGLSLRAEPGKITAVFGANGAGKSSIMRAVMGLAKCSGSILMNDVEISGLPPNKRAGLGLGYVLEGRRLFRNLTVNENLELSWRFGRRALPFSAARDLIFETFPILAERRLQKAGLLSGGQQQMLIISCTTVRSPRYMLLDEPSLGLAPTIVQQVFNFIVANNREFHTTILLTEQMASIGLRITDYGYVIRQGKLVLEGSKKALLAPQNNQKLKAAYL